MQVLGGNKISCEVVLTNGGIINPGMGTRKIADILGVSRNTVKKALAGDDAPVYNRGEKKINEYVEPYVDFIKVYIDILGNYI